MPSGGWGGGGGEGGHVKINPVWNLSWEIGFQLPTVGVVVCQI